RKLEQELPGKVKCQPKLLRRSVQNSELAQLQLTRIRRAPAAASFVFVPPENRRAQRTVAGRLDVQVDLFAGSRLVARKQRRMAVIDIKTTPRNAIVPQQRLRAAGESKHQWSPCKLSRHDSRDMKPCGGPHRSPSPADTDRPKLGAPDFLERNR